MAVAGSKSIEDIAKDYGFKPRVYPHLKEQNGAFLAMLHEFIGKTGHSLPEKVNALDFGCGPMSYIDGLTAFLEGYGRSGHDPRQVRLVCADGDSKILLDFMAIYGFMTHTAKMNPGTKLSFLKGSALKIRKDMAYLSKATGVDKLDIITMFAPAPIAGIGENGQLDLFAYHRSAIRGDYLEGPLRYALKPRMSENSLLVIGDTQDGARKELILPILERTGFQIILSEQNSYREKLSGMANKYSNIIVARNSV